MQLRNPGPALGGFCFCTHSVSFFCALPFVFCLCAAPQHHFSRLVAALFGASAPFFQKKKAPRCARARAFCAFDNIDWIY
ncbi:hypothetical protein HanRHA438_Chr07g0317291 [Helianthus annuus]|nr:hypothetical protein HanIR_Chr07g0332781 [Helianthus annuus]KAJ0909052.1 hypothetical protein HanRHA438_Chr07g0317291 [Helianthus annuus]